MSMVFLQKDERDNGETIYNVMSTGGGVVATVFEPGLGPGPDPVTAT